jgi:hypothetical protein
MTTFRKFVTSFNGTGGVLSLSLLVTQTFVPGPIKTINVSFCENNETNFTNKYMTTARKPC